MQLSGIDLNLLVLLDALLQTHSVKDAASRVGLSPSAASHSLSRLRELFDDPLLVRAGRSVVLSARAEGLRLAVHEALAAVDEVFAAGQDVEPATLQRRFTVATTDYVTLILLQPVGTRLAQVAPGVEIHERRGPDSVVEDLRRGTADLALGIHAEVPTDVVRQPLFKERFVCLVRRGHSILAQGLTLDAFCELDHVLVAPQGTGAGVVDSRLEAAGRQRRLARTTRSFLAAPHLLPGTDFVLTLPSRLAVRYAALLDLVMVEPPLELFEYTVSLLWHRRFDQDGPHRWFRSELAETAAEVTGCDATSNP